MGLVGVCSGGITSLIGASGVMIVVPALNLVFELSVHEAIGTSLMVDVIASLAVAYTYYRHGNIDLGRGFWIAIGSVIGAQIGALFASGLPEHGLGAAFGLVLIVAGVIMWRRGLSSEALSRKLAGRAKFNTNKQRIIAAVGLGFVLGIISGIFGAGGGVMVLLVLIFVLNFSVHKAIGTSTLIMAITALSGAVGYGVRGNVDLVAGLVVGAGTVIGGVSGARFANKVDEKTLSKVVSVVFIVLGIVMTVIRIVSSGT
jgi:uncharacterized membrane protein YfcA